ncbi:Glycylpeptide N-tetradecanoyltransferase [Escovopsis weberi]|uniref:Glycylpeptide N-tetradecanoyltransferase n=1 Tax=Escovopsis weberi TaxID=150374 RepID=A0A0M9VW35_ESCWE|nr:Glycylpeptide N-tetradecanoyltransferase [Escovopsis weberi]
MPAEEPKPAERAINELVDAAQSNDNGPAVDDESEEEDEPVAAADGAASGPSASKNKKRRKNKKKKAQPSGDAADQKDAPGVSGQDDRTAIGNALTGLSPSQLRELVSLNPSLAAELSGEDMKETLTPEMVAEKLKGLSVRDIMTGLAASGKNAKDMASYKFWQTQPVPRFGEESSLKAEGPLRVSTVDQVAKQPAALVEGFKWVTMDLTDEGEMREVYELLNGHYVEDDEAMFRFNYKPGILKWAMMAPGWDKKYHVGVRAEKSGKLVAFISAVPVDVRVRNNVFKSSEVNFLCVHKKLRGKRLAPVLIKEITRISNLNEIWQGLFTAGIVLPKPVSTCRYYHRPLNWQKLYECSFVHLPSNSKPQYQVRKYALPETTSTKGLRVMRPDDIDAVLDLMDRYMARYDMTPKMNKEEATHWLTPAIDQKDDQFIWSYVVEDANKKITDFFSFYCIESSAINNPRHSVIRVAYLFYYATEVALTQPADKEALKTRLNGLINDALVIARQAKFDVFNALSLMDNGLFLTQQKFGAGDGSLHYYLFNYNAHPIAGGVDMRNQLDEDHLSGIGIVLP